MGDPSRDTICITHFDPCAREMSMKSIFVKTFGILAFIIISPCFGVQHVDWAKISIQALTCQATAAFSHCCCCHIVPEQELWSDYHMTIDMRKQTCIAQAQVQILFRWNVKTRFYDWVGVKSIQRLFAVVRHIQRKIDARRCANFY